MLYLAILVITCDKTVNAVIHSLAEIKKNK